MALVSKNNVRKDQLQVELAASKSYITSGYQLQKEETDDSFAEMLSTGKQEKLIAILMVEGKN